MNYNNSRELTVFIGQGSTEHRHCWQGTGDPEGIRQALGGIWNPNPNRVGHLGSHADCPGAWPSDDKVYEVKAELKFLQEKSFVSYMFRKKLQLYRF